MPDDVPSDVFDVLSQLLAEGVDAVSTGDVATARQTVETTQRVSRNKLPDGELRDQLLHGCESVLNCIEEGEPNAAAAYVRAMQDRLATHGDRDM